MKKVSPHRDIMIYDPRWGYRYQPNIVARTMHEGGGYLIKTNSQGFRCENENISCNEGEKKILILGDSYTAGDGVSNALRFSNKLEKKLKNTKVFNLGLSGSGTDQQLLIFNEYRETISHDLVILMFQIENVKRNVLRKRVWIDRYGNKLNVPKPWYEIAEDAKLKLSGVPVKKPFPKETEPLSVLKLTDKLKIRLSQNHPELKKFIQKILRIQPLPEYNTESKSEWKLLKKLLVEFKSVSKKPIIIVLYPTYQFIEGTASYNQIRKRFEKLSKDHNLDCLHLLDGFQKLPVEKQNGLWFQYDHHPTAFAHQVTSEIIHTYLKKKELD